jgi:hypothetical protein
MKKFTFLVVLLALLLVSCAPSPAVGPSAPQATRATGTEPASGPTPAASSAVPAKGSLEDAVISQLAANLGLDPSTIAIVSNELTEFPDACLGVSLPDVMCAQVITAGRTLVLEAQGMSFEYHTTEDGTLIQPASIALSWNRQGGIAGFCDALVVFRSGEVYASRCKPAAETRTGSLASVFTPAELDQFKSWLQRFGPLEIDASEPQTGADRMTITLKLQGTGTQVTITPAEQAAFVAFAEQLFIRLFSEGQVK